MTTITNFSNTPQAMDDVFANTGLTEDSGSGTTFNLNVMANDLGGKAKTLYSLDDGLENDGAAGSDLLIRDVVGFDNSSKAGALIEITADGTVAYTMTATSTAHFQSLAAGEVGTDTFTYAIRLGNGTLSWATVTVGIMGTNDVPVITSMKQSGSVTEDAALTATGRVTSSDVDNGATATYSGNAVGSYGSFAVATTGEWTYTMDNANHQNLAQGESRSETFAVTVTDDKGATATQNVVITITGTNDAPVITSTAQSGSVTEDTALTATGTVASSDVDNGATATYSGNASGSYGSFAVAASTGEWTYTLDNDAAQNLAAGETHSETFAVTVTDDKGATATQNVVITITGTNDVPMITSDDQAGSVKEDATQTATGKVTSSDVDNDATATYSGNASGNYGSFAIDASTGEWTYTLDNDAAQNLADGETHDETFTVTVTDDKDGIATQDVVITINGTNEVPVITSTYEAQLQDVASLPSVFTDGGDPNDFDNSGNSYGTTITGSNVNSPETIYGGGGDDIINGRNGSDTIYGGSGDDTINGDSIGDTLYGGSGNDTIGGGSGNDTIIGGFGADSITGGANSDTIRYLDLLDTGDTITDFKSGTDKIDLSAIDANNAVDGNQAFAGGGEQGGLFALANSVTWYVDNGNTVVLADTDGDVTTAEFSITLTGVTNLALTDFNTL